MASVVEICNRALQKLGAKRISDIDEDSINARACKACYETLRDALLEAHPWSFAIQRFSLAADANAPSWGRANSFTVPTSTLRVLPPYPEDNSPYRDWIMEDKKILTDEGAPLDVRCVVQVTDANKMHVLFREALSTKMAFEMCEELTQSNTKKADLKDDLRTAIAEAKKRSAIESVPVESVKDTWETGRV